MSKLFFLILTPILLVSFLPENKAFGQNLEYNFSQGQVLEYRKVLSELRNSDYGIENNKTCDLYRFTIDSVTPDGFEVTMIHLINYFNRSVSRMKYGNNIFQITSPHDPDSVVGNLVNWVDLNQEIHFSISPRGDIRNIRGFENLKENYWESTMVTRFATRSIPFVNAKLRYGTVYYEALIHEFFPRLSKVTSYNFTMFQRDVKIHEIDAGQLEDDQIISLKRIAKIHYTDPNNSEFSITEIDSSKQAVWDKSFAVFKTLSYTYNHPISRFLGINDSQFEWYAKNFYSEPTPTHIELIRNQVNGSGKAKISGTILNAKGRTINTYLPLDKISRTSAFQQIESDTAHIEFEVEIDGPQIISLFCRQGKYWNDYQRSLINQNNVFLDAGDSVHFTWILGENERQIEFSGANIREQGSVALIIFRAFFTKMMNA